MSSQWPQSFAVTLCTIGSRFTNVTESPGATWRTVGVKHASTIATVVPVVSVTPVPAR